MSLQVFPLLYDLLQPTACDALFDKNSLRDYILFCCQSDNGGLRDKPGKHRCVVGVRSMTVVL